MSYFPTLRLWEYCPSAEATRAIFPQLIDDDSHYLFCYTSDRNGDGTRTIVSQSGGSRCSDSRYSDKHRPTTYVWFSVFQVEVHVKVGNTAPLNARRSGTELLRYELGLM